VSGVHVHIKYEVVLELIFKGVCMEHTRYSAKKLIDYIVPMPNRDSVLIKHMSANTGKETLGVHTCPSGKASSQIKANAKESSGMDQQGQREQAALGRGLGRGLVPAGSPALAEGRLWIMQCCSAMEGAGWVIENKWWQIVPIYGLIHSAPHDIRDTDIGFYGVGCPH